MITQDGWLDWAAREPGPADKTYSAPNKALGYVPHSAVGYYTGWKSRLFSQDRDAKGNYTAFAAASVHGWIAYDGSVIQHYRLDTSCWASGSAYPNTTFVAFENEGGPPGRESEPLTDAQVQTNIRIIRELAAWRAWAPGTIHRPINNVDLSAQLYEHIECVRFGSAPTACPSKRVPWDRILEAINGQAPAPSRPAAIDILYALASAGQFVRMGWDLHDLIPQDKDIIRWLQEQTS
jgi:hypothetical protein